MLGSNVFSGPSSSQTVAGGPLSLTLNSITALYVSIKLGNTDIFIKSLLGPQTFTYAGGAGQGAGVSGYAFFGDAPTVPLPAAAWMMLAGIGGLTAASRRKKAA
ncbi:MAG: VPLPA-CTERM sorting domain-containing protein [Parvularculaceae bacterium]|nr:VPLPA-CTERM sorting domain-containing protein [Parvularculaceae bacterium]